MDSFKNAVGLGEGQGNGNSEDNQQKSSGGGFGGIGDKLNEAAGGGKAGEAKEDYLDKGIDAAQQYGLGEGKQDNESAVEQAKDHQIAEFIRDKYKSTTGDDLPGEKK